MILQSNVSLEVMYNTLICFYSFYLCILIFCFWLLKLCVHFSPLALIFDIIKLKCCKRLVCIYIAQSPPMRSNIRVYWGPIRGNSPFYRTIFISFLNRPYLFCA